MSDVFARQSTSLGEVPPARSRHAGRRSTVALVGDLVFVGTASGDVVAFDRESLAERWRTRPEHGEPGLVSSATLADSVVVGERSARGAVRCYDAETGTLRWRYETADDLGPPQKESRFFLPFVADIERAGGRLSVAARRYERDGGSRSFRSVVYCFDPDGTVEWRYETDASPISLDADGERVAVAYNRCPGEYQHGLAVLDAVTGEVRYHWDPGTGGQRRVGDVSLLPEGLAVVSHGDYCGYRLADGGAQRWRVELATPTEIDGEKLYAYPNHVHASADGVVFVTGNTYAAESRETESLHPREHTVFGYSAAGERRWSEDTGGFAHGIDAAGDRVSIPSAQQFRIRDPDVHGLSVFETGTGLSTAFDAEGVITATAIDDQGVIAVEEPVSYHDENEVHGEYRLHAESER